MYRVDRRQYAIGELIETPTNSYQSGVNFNDDKRNLEIILENTRPNTIAVNRECGLFIFPELSDAIRFSCVMTDSKIYKVHESSETLFFHRGDMNLTEAMTKLIGNDSAMRTLAQSYWNGEKTFKPCWEVLVNKVQVTQIIIKDNDSRKKLCSNFKITAQQNIEKVEFYLNTLTNE